VPGCLLKTGRSAPAHLRTFRASDNCCGVNLKFGTRALKGLTALALLGLLVSLPLTLIGYLAQVEHVRRVEVLATGFSASARVTKSFSWSSRGCAFTYNFTYNGKLYEGGEGGCPLVADHPVGSALNIRFDPNDPRHSVAVGADHWPGWSIVPYLLAVPLLILGGLTAFAIIRGPQRSRRWRNAAGQ
jgi:hypothetical protein